MSNINPYDIQTLSLGPNDVILFHVDENCGLDEIKIIQKEMEAIFPNNTVLVANELILKRITLFKAEDPLKKNLIENELQIEINQMTIDKMTGITGTYEGTKVFDILY